MKANEMQVGGDHYRSSLQHWDVVTLYNVPYLEGCASKYVSRWRKKNGLQDLEKALHFVTKLKEVVSARGGARNHGRGTPRHRAGSDAHNRPVSRTK